jgi:hypothetical protein
MMNKEQKLFELCQKFIHNQRITCSEDIYQSDRVIENAYTFIEDICDIVGYMETDDE